MKLFKALKFAFSNPKLRASLARMKFPNALKHAFSNPKLRPKALLYSLALFLLLGIPTALLPNPIIPYIRMTPATPLDYLFLLTTSLLAGAYLVLPAKTSCPNKTALGGGALGFLAFSCPICNHILVLALGMSLMSAVVDPLRPLLWLLSIAILSYAIEKKVT